MARIQVRHHMYHGKSGYLVIASGDDVPGIFGQKVFTSTRESADRIAKRWRQKDWDTDKELR